MKRYIFIPDFLLFLSCFFYLFDLGLKLSPSCVHSVKVFWMRLFFAISGHFCIATCSPSPLNVSQTFSPLTEVKTVWKSAQMYGLGKTKLLCSYFLREMYSSNCTPASLAWRISSALAWKLADIVARITSKHSVDVYRLLLIKSNSISESALFIVFQLHFEAYLSSSSSSAIATRRR